MCCSLFGDGEGILFVTKLIVELKIMSFVLLEIEKRIWGGMRWKQLMLFRSENQARLNMQK